MNPEEDQLEKVCEHYEDFLYKQEDERIMSDYVDFIGTTNDQELNMLWDHYGRDWFIQKLVENFAIEVKGGFYV